MLDDEPASHDADLVGTVRLAPDRADELRRLAANLGKDEGVLAKELLENEIEAEHGLTIGPWRRKFMYRR